MLYGLFGNGLIYIKAEIMDYCKKVKAQTQTEIFVTFHAFISIWTIHLF